MFYIYTIIHNEKEGQYMRQAGILLAVSSLPSKHGIGDFGYSARTFIREANKTGFKLWQILPINPVGYGNSPYQPFGSKPFDELYISLEILQKEGLLDTVPLYFPNSKKVHYDKVRKFKLRYLKEAFLNYKKFKKRGFKKWVRENEWVNTYATFITFKKANDLVQWHYWEPAHRAWIHAQNSVDLTPYASAIEFEKWLQYIAYTQWQKLRAYAHKYNIMIVGDIPIYVGIDSIDVWENRQAFLLDDDDMPTFVGGVPGDYFNADGQLWGNPLYDWDYLAKTNFAFWIDRLAYAHKLYDYVRIDHFRAFDSYWKIPAGSEKATSGHWDYPPGYALFDEIFRAIPDILIIAEDLGDLRPEVLELRDHYNLPGMEITQFTFNPYEKRGDEWKENRLVYPGTHDNSPIRGWFRGRPRKFFADADVIFKKAGTYEFANFYDNFIAYNIASDARYVVFQMQDLLRLGESSKMNSPSTIGSPNWEWKMVDFTSFRKEREFLTYLLQKYDRV